MIDIRFRPRYISRTQTAFTRALKVINVGEGQRPGYQPNFNVHSLLRLHDMNPPIYVCSIMLLDSDVQIDPPAIQDSLPFKHLITHLVNDKNLDSPDDSRIPLVLLEVFTYMIIIDRARKEEAAQRSATSQSYDHQEELIS